MRASQFLISTKKESPADAEIISHKLMLRAGMIRKLASGLYTWLPMGLTVGIAVDANVLIFSRIKEEISNGLPPQSAISAGYDRAFVSIVDANVTTLIVAVILFIIGSGPVQGFAVTLSIGILVSMFTAIIVTRALVNLSFGNRSIEKLRI